MGTRRGGWACVGGPQGLARAAAQRWRLRCSQPAGAGLHSRQEECPQKKGQKRRQPSGRPAAFGSPCRLLTGMGERGAWCGEAAQAQVRRGHRGARGPSPKAPLGAHRGAQRRSHQRAPPCAHHHQHGHPPLRLLLRAGRRRRAGTGAGWHRVLLTGAPSCASPPHAFFPCVPAGAKPCCAGPPPCRSPALRTAHLGHAVQQAAVHGLLVGGVLGAVPLKRLVRLALQVVLQRLQRRLRGGGPGDAGGTHVGGECTTVKGIGLFMRPTRALSAWPPAPHLQVVPVAHLHHLLLARRLNLPAGRGGRAARARRVAGQRGRAGQKGRRQAVASVLHAAARPALH